MPMKLMKQNKGCRPLGRLAALRETIARKGLTKIQQMRMYEFGLTTLLKMSQ